MWLPPLKKGGSDGASGRLKADEKTAEGVAVESTTVGVAAPPEAFIASKTFSFAQGRLMVSQISPRPCGIRSRGEGKGLISDTPCMQATLIGGYDATSRSHPTSRPHLSSLTDTDFSQPTPATTCFSASQSEPFLPRPGKSTTCCGKHGEA
ncbi:hypothetical protein Landi51_02678 [Colletotrichum acutatum]